MPVKTTTDLIHILQVEMDHLKLNETHDSLVQAERTKVFLENVLEAAQALDSFIGRNTTLEEASAKAKQLFRNMEAPNTKGAVFGRTLPLYIAMLKGEGRKGFADMGELETSVGGVITVCNTKLKSLDKEINKLERKVLEMDTVVEDMEKAVKALKRGKYDSDPYWFSEFENDFGVTGEYLVDNRVVHFLDFDPDSH